MWNPVIGGGTTAMIMSSRVGGWDYALKNFFTVGLYFAILFGAI
jgi:hypothetical protein